MNSDHLETLVLAWVKSNWKYSYVETPQILQQINRFLGAQNCLGFVLCEETDRDGPFALLSLEIEADVQASTLLAISGFYRHANLPLRSWLSLAFASLWFSFAPAHFDSWFNRKPKAPFQHDGVMEKRTLAELMRKTPELRKVESEFNLVADSMKLHTELCDFVHARGKPGLDVYLRDDSVPHFYPQHFETWLGCFVKIFETWAILAFARYPKLFKIASHLKEKQEIVSTLSSETNSKLSLICNLNQV